jgi:hypothetical protein
MNFYYYYYYYYDDYDDAPLQVLQKEAGRMSFCC